MSRRLLVKIGLGELDQWLPVAGDLHDADRDVEAEDARCPGEPSRLVVGAGMGWVPELMQAAQDLPQTLRGGHGRVVSHPRILSAVRLADGSYPG